jgi:hypothetical protein
VWWDDGAVVVRALVLDVPVAGLPVALDEADAGVLWLAEVLWLVELAAEVELDDDPPHAASSSISDPSPAVAHPLLRIMSLSLQDDPFPGLPGLSRLSRLGLNSRTA